MRNKILEERFAREDCKDENVFKFLSLSKQPEYWEKKEYFWPIIEEEWVGVVKRVKKRSASSIYSRRTYTLYKYALVGGWLIILLVTYYSIIIRYQYFLTRW